MFRKSMIAAIALALSLCLLQGSKTIAGEKGVLYCIPIVETGTYWTIMKIGAIEKAKELGYELILRTSPPAEVQKSEKHVGFLTEAIMQGADGIAIAPMDPDMFDRKVAEARNEGIPVVTFDTDVATKANRVAFVGTDNFSAGELMGKQGAEILKAQGVTSGKLALVTVNLWQNQPDRPPRRRDDGVQGGDGRGRGQFHLA
jgi:ribose transport system substrate-binding protein